jgi:uncharacterized protein YegP (UPF0339 family)
MKAFKIEVWKDRAGGFSWHARARNGRIITPSESFTRYRRARENIEAAYPQILLPKTWIRGAARLMVLAQKPLCGIWGMKGGSK